MKRKIAIIAPYEELSVMAQEVIKELNLAITIWKGSMEEGVAQARQAAKQGAEVIISRGGTANLIRECLGLPVVEIEVSGYDLLRALYQMRDYRGKIGVAGFHNVIYGCKTIKEILGMEVIEIVFRNNGTFEDQVEIIKEAVGRNVDFLVGDVVGAKIAEEIGLQWKLITSGKEAIISAVGEAERVAAVRRQERHRAEQLKTIVDFVTDGIIAVDEEGLVTVFNPIAEKLFRVNAKEVIGKKISHVIPEIRMHNVLESHQPEVGEIQMVGDNHLARNLVPIIIKKELLGAVATFEDITKIQKLEQKIRRTLHTKGLTAKTRFEHILGKSPVVKEAINKAKKYGLVDSTVLITGETGTGKEMFAQGIHNISSRQRGPFVAINCAAVPEALLESELFGYTEGAFTGAKKEGKPGLFELAHGGTLFLDEIGEMPLALQARLLRVVQEREVMRIGDQKVIPVDVRIIAATNRDLQRLVDKGSFREDLLYRINVLTLKLPPLRQRREDIPLLVRVFMGDIHARLNIPPKNVDEQVLDALVKLEWKGNVRQLRNVVEKLVVLSTGPTITHDDLGLIMQDAPFLKENLPPKPFLNETLEDMEKRVIQQFLAEEEFNKTQTAKRLGIDRSTLWRKLRKHNIVADSNVD